eukprot:m.357811 g.357811  ORF g.357811 m.357811 type:complete len:104 (-) comp17943_c0_seq1:1923-2234(-)
MNEKGNTQFRAERLHNKTCQKAPNFYVRGATCCCVDCVWFRIIPPLDLVHIHDLINSPFALTSTMMCFSYSSPAAAASASCFAAFISEYFSGSTVCQKFSSAC